MRCIWCGGRGIGVWIDDHPPPSLPPKLLRNFRGRDEARNGVMMASVTIVTIGSGTDWHEVGLLRAPGIRPARHEARLYSVAGTYQQRLPIYEAEITQQLNGWDTLDLVTDAGAIGPESDQRIVILRAGINQGLLGRLNTFLVTDVSYRANLAQVSGVCGGALLDRAIVDYPADQATTSKQGPVDSVMKEIVDENLVSPTDATRTMGRVQVEADGSWGETYDGAFAHEIVSQQLLDMADWSREQGEECLFRMVDVGGTPGNPLWEFRTYPGFVDVSNVIFSEAAGNARDVVLKYGYGEEATVVVVGGKGTGAERTFRRVRNAGRIAKEPNNWRHVERFLHWPRSTSADVLDAAGNRELGRRAARVRLEGTIVETTLARYLVDWRLGSLVTVQAYGRSVAALVRSVRIQIEANKSVVEAKIGGDL